MSISITVDAQTCTRCRACVAICSPAQVFQLGSEAAEVIRVEDCWLCGHCVAVCPVDAIEHSEYRLEECPAIEPLPSYEELVAAVRERRSARVFRDKPVPRDMVSQLVDVSRWAPNASNDQIIDWIAVDDSGQIARLSVEVATTLGGTARLLQNSLLRPFLYVMYGRTKIQEALANVQDFQRLAENSAQGLDPIFYGAPVVLVAHARKGAYFGREDALYASYNLMLAAQRLGLGTCHIGWFNVALERNPGLQDILGLPPERQIEVVLILGYPRFKFGRALPRRQMALAWNPG